MIIGGSGSGKINTLLNLINQQDDIGKIYLYAKDFSEPNYKTLIKNCESVRIEHLNNSNALQWMKFLKVLMITTQAEKGKL